MESFQKMNPTPLMIVLTKMISFQLTKIDSLYSSMSNEYRLKFCMKQNAIALDAMQKPNGLIPFKHPNAE